MNNRSGIELTFLLSSGESLFIKIDSLKDSLNALFSQHKIEKSLKFVELQQIAINHSVDIDYKDFLKVYRYCTKEPYSFLTINTTLPADNHMRFRKNFFILCFIKMTLTEQVKILDDKIKSNKAQYDLDREAAKISALSSKDLEKYEYLTGEDLGHKPDVIERAKFEYSALGEAFNKVFKKDDKNKIVIKHDNDLVYNSVHNF